MIRKMYWDQANTPKLFQIKVLLDIHSKLGKEYVPYNEFMSKTLTKVNIKQTIIKIICSDYIMQPGEL